MTIGVCGMGTNMKYELAVKEKLQDVYDVVQHTIKTIYPKYYPAEVVNFFSEHHNKAATLYEKLGFYTIKHKNTLWKMKLYLHMKLWKRCFAASGDVVCFKFFYEELLVVSSDL